MAGILTRAQIESEALDNIAKGSTVSLQSGNTLSTRMTTWVNRAQTQIARRIDLLQYIASSTTVVDQQFYAFPEKIRCIYGMKLEDGLNSRKLTCMMPWEFDRKVPLPSAITSLRSWYYVPYKQTGQFELFPLPDAGYTLRLRYSVFPSDFTSSAGVSQYTNLDDALVAYATMYGFRWLQELKDAEEWRMIGDKIVDAEADIQDDASNFPDWAPASEGFTVQDIDFTGQYYSNPFIRDSNLNTWWR